MGERGMQSLEEDYLVSSTQLGEGSSRVLNAVDPNFRHPHGSGVANQLPHQQHQRLSRSADSYDPDISPARYSRGSPKSRGFSPDSRPISPSQEAVLHSKQRGFSFSGGGGSNSGRESPTNNGFKVFTREQLPDGSFTVRPITLMDYMEREESLRHSIEEQLQPQPIALPRTSSAAELSAKKRLMAASRIPKPLSFAATPSQELLPPPRAQTSQLSLSKASSDSGLRPLSRHTASAPVKLGIKNSYRGPQAQIHSANASEKGGSFGGPMVAGSLIMDDSLYGDDEDSLDADRVHTKSIHFADDDPVEKKPTSIHPSSSYNKVILSRWTPPMCYSKKKAQDHFLHQRSHSPMGSSGGPHPSLESPPGSAPQLEAYFAMKPRLKNPGKTFEQLDYHISSKKHHQRRPKTTSTMY